MIASVEIQTYVFFLSILIGILLGLIYDIIKVIRKCFRAGIILTCLLDSVFWLILCIVFFVFGVSVAGGLIRGYIFIGGFLGMLLYFLTLSQLFLGLVFGVIKIINKSFQKINNLIYEILKKTLSFFGKKG